MEWYYQTDIDSKEFTRDIIDNLSEIEFLKKNENHYLLFNNEEPIDESIFRMLCQEYSERTGILEKNITWFNETLNKGYAILSFY